MKRPAPGALPRLRDLPPGEDLVRVAELVQAAAPLPDLGADARQRMRASLRRELATTDTRRPRWAFRLSPALVALAALVSASVVGAAVRSLLIERRLERQEGGRPQVSVVDVGPRKSPRRARAPGAVDPLTPAAQQDLPGPQAPGALQNLAPADVSAPGSGQGEPAPAVPQPSPVARHVVVVPAPVPHERLRPAAPALPAALPPDLVPDLAPAPASETAPRAPAAEAPSSPGQLPAPTSPPPVAFVPVPVPIAAAATAPAPRPDRRPLALATPRKPAVAAPPVASAMASSTEAELLAEVIRTLRRDGDANGALALLTQHRLRLASGPLAPEAAAVRIEALLQARRTSAALAELDQLSLDDVPGRDEWRIVRAELRGRAGRWREAEGDFSLVLTGEADHLRDELMERALWGRALARAQQGNTAGARGDQSLYLQRFPDGRFAVHARRALSTPVSNEPHAP